MGSALLPRRSVWEDRKRWREPKSRRESLLLPSTDRAGKLELAGPPPTPLSKLLSREALEVTETQPDETGTKPEGDTTRSVGRGAKGVGGTQPGGRGGGVGGAPCSSSDSIRESSEEENPLLSRGRLGAA